MNHQNVDMSDPWTVLLLMVTTLIAAAWGQWRNSGPSRFEPLILKVILGALAAVFVVDVVRACLR